MRILLVLLVSVSLCSSSQHPQVNTSQGVIVGSYYDGIERFAGIPYALAPIGERRFARAQLNENIFETPFDATKLGAPCIQNPIGDPRPPSLHDVPQPSEDCLSLNIFRPRGDEIGLFKHPVMVYAFGGGLCSGSASNHYFDGTTFAKEHGVIVVVVSYRLGALGFLPLLNFDDDNETKLGGGMNGLYDIVCALEWIKRHITSFGGNKDDVTLFGQSSGGYATCTLSVSPKSEGLISRAVIESGPCAYGPAHRTWGPMNLSYAQVISETVLESLQCDDIECLRSIEDPTRIRWPDVIMNTDPYFSGYFEDEWLVPTLVSDRWKDGLLIENLDLILGFNSKDGTAAFYGTAPLLGEIKGDPKETSELNYSKHMSLAWGRSADAVMKQYPLTDYNGSVQSAFIQADADAYVICPTLQLARDASTKTNVYVYEFAHFHPNRDDSRGFGCDNGVELDVVSASNPVSTLWASHGSEVQFVFGTEMGSDGLGPPNNLTTCTFSKSERELSRTMTCFWSSFARTGNPNNNSRDDGGCGKNKWEIFSSSDVGTTMLFRENNVQSVISRHAKQCKFWYDFY